MLIDDAGEAEVCPRFLEIIEAVRKTKTFGHFEKLDYRSIGLIQSLTTSNFKSDRTCNISS